MKRNSLSFIALSSVIATGVLSGCGSGGLFKGPSRGTLSSDNQLSAQENNICVSMEGNGENFSSHFGGFIALMERGLNPAVVAGGSSGAPVAAIIRMLMANPSITSPQDAAKVLASSVTVFQSMLFLPTLNDLLTASASFAVGFAAQRAKLGFVSNPDYSFAHAEAITSQLVIAAQFFGYSDFKDILAQSDFQQRVTMSKQLYVQSLNMLAVTPEEFVSALLTPAEQAKSPTLAERNREIRRRYFLLFQSNIPREKTKSAEQAWEEYETRLSLFGFATNDNLRSKAAEIYMKTLPKIRTLPFVGALAATVGKPFLLPSPEVLANALESKDKQGNVMPIPNGTIVHTTTRLGKVRNSNWIENQLFKRRLYSEIVQPEGNKRIDDEAGFENLYQFYFANPELTEMMQTAQQRNSGYLLFSKNERGQRETPLAASENAMALGGLNLQQAITASVSEPGVFRRIPIAMKTLKSGDISKLPKALQDPNAYVITYGGWLDTSANSTLSLLDSCAPDKIGHYVYFHPNRLTNKFQEDALTDSNNWILNPLKRSNIKELMVNLGTYLARSRALNAINPSIDFNWNWDVPVDNNPDMSLTLKQSRPLYLYAAYEAYRKILNTSPGIARNAEPEISSFGDSSHAVIEELLSGKPESEIARSIYGDGL
jgi:hypothetical protein